jgi:hypothetical protein
LAKDEVGKNEVATAVAAATRINFLIVFRPRPCSQTGQNVSAGIF